MACLENNWLICFTKGIIIRRGVCFKGSLAKLCRERKRSLVGMSWMFTGRREKTSSVCW